MSEKEILKLSKLGFPGLEVKSIQEWIESCEKAGKELGSHQSLLRFFDEKGYHATDPISWTEFLTLMAEF